MPELPEVETVRRSLEPHLVGARIADVDVRERRLRRPIQADIAVRLRRRCVQSIERRGKYLLFALDGPDTMLVHLGMSGALELRATAAACAPHDHVLLHLDGGRTLVFNDPRRFGLLRVAPRAALVELAAVGPDALGEEWPAARLKVLARGRRLSIKNLLMDQRGLGGLGNIYVNEILFRAGIRPRRAAASLRGREFEALAVALRAVLAEAVRLGGSSISDFRDGEGRPGYFQLHLAVYDRAGKPCRNCETAIRRVVVGGRSSFYCPRCQR